MTGPRPAHASQHRTGVGAEFAASNNMALFDLEADPGETTNLLLEPAHAATARRLLARLRALALEMVEPMRWEPPYQGPSWECASCARHPASVSPAEAWTPWN